LSDPTKNVTSVMPIFSLPEKCLTLRQKQYYRFHCCGHQFSKSPIPKVYHPEVKQLYLKMYLKYSNLIWKVKEMGYIKALILKV